MNTKKLLVIGILGLFMFSMLAVVSASKFSDFWDDNMKGDKAFMPGLFGSDEKSQAGLAKILLITLVVLMVYAIGDKLPFLGGEGKDTIRWVFSIIVGILSFMFVSKDAIMALVSNYEALGFALTSIIPLVILMMFFWELRDNGHEVVAGLIEKPLLFVFAGYLVVRWLVLAGEGNAYVWFYIAGAAIALIWGFKSGDIWKAFKKGKVEQDLIKFKEAVDKSTASDTIKADSVDAVSKERGN